MKTTVTLVMLTRDSVMHETSAEVFCQSERASNIYRIAEAMRKEYVSDFRIVTKIGRQVIQGPLLRSYKVNQCPKCLREYTYNDLQEAREQEKIDFCDLLCECGCSFMIDWQFDPVKKVRPPVVWTREEPANEPAGPCPRCNGTLVDAHDYHRKRPCPLCVTEPTALDTCDVCGKESDALSLLETNGYAFACPTCQPAAEEKGGQS